MDVRVAYTFRAPGVSVAIAQHSSCQASIWAKTRAGLLSRRITFAFGCNDCAWAVGGLRWRLLFIAPKRKGLRVSHIGVDQSIDRQRMRKLPRRRGPRRRVLARPTTPKRKKQRHHEKTSAITKLGVHGETYSNARAVLAAWFSGKTALESRRSRRRARFEVSLAEDSGRPEPMGGSAGCLLGATWFG